MCGDTGQYTTEELGGGDAGADVTTPEESRIKIEQIDDPDNDDEVEDDAKSADKFSKTKVQEKPEKREQWGSKVEYLLTLVGFAVGFGNIWRFPYQMRENGGLAFLIPYFFMLFVLGMPMFFLELTVGQRQRKGVIQAWSEVSPLFGGIGIASGVICFIIALYYIPILSYCFIYLIDSCFGHFPWESCEHTFDSEWQKPTKAEKASFREECEEKVGGKASKYYWFKGVLNISPEFDKYGGYSWRLFVFISIAWLIIFLILVKGMKAVGKLVYFSAIFPYVVLLIFFINNCIQEPAKGWLGAYRLLKPDWRKLYNPITWLKAGSQIFFSLDLAEGCLVVFASYNHPRNNVRTDTLSVTLINSLSSLFASLVVFPIVGLLGHKEYDDCVKRMKLLYPFQYKTLDNWEHEKYDIYVHTKAMAWTDLDNGIQNKMTIYAMDRELNSEEDFASAFKDAKGYFDVTSSAQVAMQHYLKGVYTSSCSIGLSATASGGGTGFVFIAFTEAVKTMKGSHFWSFLFFFMLVFLGIDSGFGTVEATIVTLQELTHLKRWKATAIIVFVLWACSVVIFPAGFGKYCIDLINDWAVDWTLLIVAGLECVAVSWSYGLAKFSYDIHLMTGRKPTWYMLLSWRWVTPAVIIAMLVGSIVQLVYDMIGGIKYTAFDPNFNPNDGGDAEKNMPIGSLCVGFFLMILSVIGIPLQCCLRKTKWSLIRQEAPAEFPEEELREERQINVAREEDQFSLTERKIMGKQSLHSLQSYRDTQVANKDGDAGSINASRESSGISLEAKPQEKPVKSSKIKKP